MITADAAAERRIVNRLKRARGQLNAVIDAAENGGDCRTVVAQLAAVSSALDRAGFAIIATAMRDCLVDDESNDLETDAATVRPSRLSVDELEKLFLSLA